MNEKEQEQRINPGEEKRTQIFWKEKEGHDLPLTFGTILTDNKNVREKSLLFMANNEVYKIDELPKAFDGREVWKFYLSPIKEQGYCGNCWAIASVGMLSDRFSILSKNYVKPYLSPTTVTLCESVISPRPIYDPKAISDNNIEKHAKGSCFGAAITNALQFLYVYGAIDDKCLNKGFLLEKGVNIQLSKTQGTETLPNCQDIVGTDYNTCVGDAKVAARYFRASTFYTLEADEINMKREIFKFGPIVSGFIVYDNFVNDYNGIGIYMGPGKDNYPIGGHAVRCLGWGEELVQSKDEKGVMKQENVKYWIIANSWGPQWGEGGYFKMKIGIPECQFEKNAHALLPDLPFLDNPYAATLSVKEGDLIIKRKEFNVDKITGYLTSSIPLIKNGTLFGDLDPMFPKELSYDLSTFIAGKIKFVPEIFVEIRKQQRNYTGLYISIFIFTLLLISIISFFIFKRKK